MLMVQPTILHAANVSQYLVHALKVFDGGLRHELIDLADRVTEIWPGDCQVNEASDNLSDRVGSHAFPEFG